MLVYSALFTSCILLCDIPKKICLSFISPQNVFIFKFQACVDDLYFLKSSGFFHGVLAMNTHTPCAPWTEMLTSSHLRALSCYYLTSLITHCSHYLCYHRSWAPTSKETTFWGDQNFLYCSGEFNKCSLIMTYFLMLWLDALNSIQENQLSLSHVSPATYMTSQTMLW